MVGWLWGLIIDLLGETNEITDEEYYEDEAMNLGLHPISDDQDFVEDHYLNQYEDN